MVQFQKNPVVIYLEAEAVNQQYPLSSMIFLKQDSTKDIKGIILKLTPSGTVTGSDLIYRELVSVQGGNRSSDCLPCSWTKLQVVDTM